MNPLRSTVCLLLALGAASQAGASATPAAEGPGTRDEAARAWRAEGLQAIKVRGMDVAFAQPGATLQAFHSITLKPVSVEFQKNWARSAAIPTGTRLYPRDADRIREDMAGVVDREIKREFEKAGWRVVDTPGAGVLEVEVRIVDLYLNAPDLPTPGLTKSYAQSFGQLTLVAELRDSASGAIVMRLLDHVDGHDHATFVRTTRVENTREVGMVASDWARNLLRQLELARVAADRSNGRP
jgi:hypothetical protein